MRQILPRAAFLAVFGCASVEPSDSAGHAAWTGEMSTLQAGYAGYPVNCEEAAGIHGVVVDSTACPDCTYVFEVVPDGTLCDVLSDPWILGVDLDDPTRILQGDEALDHPVIGAAWDPTTGRLDFSGDVGNPAYSWPNSYSYTSVFSVEGVIWLPI